MSDLEYRPLSSRGGGLVASKKPAAARALEWLKARGGDGCFDLNGVALAQGESAPFMRATWNELEAAGLIEFYGGARDGGRGYGRLRVKP